LKKFMEAFSRWAAVARAGEDFDAFLTRREAVSGEYINGKPEPLLGISTTTDPATFFPPSGARVQGAVRVNDADMSKEDE
jgi:hypothetical protein